MSLSWETRSNVRSTALPGEEPRCCRFSLGAAWVRQHLWRRMGISFLLTREYKHLAPPCLHGEFQSDKRRQLVTYGKPLPAENPLATIPPGDSEPALTEPTSPEATEHATDEPAALGVAPSETDNSVDPSHLAVTATPCPDNLWSQLHANKHIKLASFAPTSWFDADQLESEKQTVRTGEDPDGNVDRDVHRRMHSKCTHCRRASLRFWAAS